MNRQKIKNAFIVSIIAFFFSINIVCALEGEITLSKNASKDNLIYGRTADVVLGITAESFVKTDTTDIVLMLDRSTSMNDSDLTDDTPSPMEDAKKAAIELVKTIIDNNPKNVNIAVVTYGYNYLSEYSNTKFTNKIKTLENTINSIPNEYTLKGTNTHAGLKQAYTLLNNSKAKNKIIVFLSDGVPTRYQGTKKGDNGICYKSTYDTCGEKIKIDGKNYDSEDGFSTITKAYGEYVKKQGITIYTVGFNFDKLTKTNQVIATDVLNSISSGSDYRFSANGYENLKIAFQNIAKELTIIATAGVVTDIVPTGFEIVENSLKATSGTVITEKINGKTTIKWMVGNISSTDNPKLTYQVQAKPNHYGSMYTNESATLTAKPVEGNPAYKNDIDLDFPMPVVPIPSVTKDDDYGTIKQGEKVVAKLDNTILANDELVYKHIDNNAQVVNKIVIVDDEETNGELEDLEIDLAKGTFIYTSHQDILGKVTYKYYVESYVTINGESTVVKSNTSKITLNVVKYPTTYIVNYLELDTNIVLSPAKQGNGNVFEDITETAIDIENYEKTLETTQTINLKADATNNVINFYYTKKADLNYQVNYLEKDTNKILHESKIVNNQSLGNIINSMKEIIAIEGYTYDSIDKETLVITNDENIINIYYTQNKGVVRAIYIDTLGNVLSEEVVTEGLVGAEYKTKAKEIGNYTLTKIDGEEVGKYKDELIEVKYIYELKIEEEKNDTPVITTPEVIKPAVKTGYEEENRYAILLSASGILLSILIIFRKKFM